MHVVVDWDGTMGLDDGRREHVKGTTKNYAAYHAAASEDPPNIPLVKLMKSLMYVGHRVEIWTGRTDEYRELSVAWLRQHFGSFAPRLIPTLRMRVTGDVRDTNTIKGEWADEGGWPDLVFDDRQKCVDWWRSKGVMCCQVAENT